MKHLIALLPLLLLAACDPFGLPESPPETATYYVASGETGAGTTASRVASRIAIAYQTPDGVMRDTLVSADTLTLVNPRPRALQSWSRVFERDALPSFSITATNLSGTDTTRNGFVSVSLIVDQQTVAFDSSRTEVTLSY